MMGCRDCSEIKLQTPQKPNSNVKALASKQVRLDSNGKRLTSLRWTPTPEQLFALEELYRCGTQSPTAQQIQQITCRLRRFGQIEGKNVFYWFQNHKARERQKRSREIKCIPREKYWMLGSSFGKINEIGLSRKSQEIQQAKMWMPHVKSSYNLSNQECLSKSTSSISKKIRHCGAFNTVDGLFSKQTAWKPMGSSFSPANSSSISTHLTNTSLKPSSEIQGEYFKRISDKNVEDKHVEIQTLELFPLRSSSEGHIGVQLVEDVQKAVDNNLSSRLFFEFLPLKN